MIYLVSPIWAAVRRSSSAMWTQQIDTLAERLATYAGAALLICRVISAAP